MVPAWKMGTVRTAVRTSMGSFRWTSLACHLHRCILSSATYSVPWLLLILMLMLIVRKIPILGVRYDVSMCLYFYELFYENTFFCVAAIVASFRRFRNIHSYLGSTFYRQSVFTAWIHYTFLFLRKSSSDDCVHVLQRGGTSARSRSFDRTSSRNWYLCLL